MSGQLRIADWLADPDGTGVAHAWPGAGPQFRCLCSMAYWTVRLRPASEGPLCAVCREVVAGAAFRSLEEIAEIEGGPAPITRAGVA